MSILALCIPRPSVFAVGHRDATFNQVTLLTSQIDCSEFFEKNFLTTGTSPRLPIKYAVAHKNDPGNSQTPTSFKVSMLHKSELPLAA